jgi:hypothetical protein
MKRGALVLGVLAVLLLADGSYLELSNNQVGGDTGVLFGNPNLVLSAGTVVLISGGFILLGAVIMWAVATWRERRTSGVRAQVSRPPAGEVQAQAGAEQGHGRKESGDQR